MSGRASSTTSGDDADFDHRLEERFLPRQRIDDSRWCGEVVMHGAEVEWCPVTSAWLCTPAVIHVVRVPLRTGTPLTLTNGKRSAAEWPATERYRFEEPRRPFAHMRSTLRQLLGLRVDCLPEHLTFVYGLHGKPQLAEANTAGLQRLAFG